MAESKVPGSGLPGQKPYSRSSSLRTGVAEARARMAASSRTCSILAFTLSMFRGKLMFGHKLFVIIYEVPNKIKKTVLLFVLLR